MSALWRDICIRVGDVLLGWLLWLPRDASLVLLAAISVAGALAARRWLCDRRLLRSAREDDRVLRRLIREARRAKDAAALARHRRVRAAVARLRFGQESRALAAMALLLLVLIPWASARLGYLPVRGGEPVEVVAWLPASAVGEVMHLVPQANLASSDGWIRQVAEASHSGQPRGRVAWQISAPPSTQPYRLVFRFRDRTLTHALNIGHAVSTPRQQHGGDVETEVCLPRYEPFGIPHPTRFGLPPWATGYVVATLLLMLAAAALTRSRS